MGWVVGGLAALVFWGLMQALVAQHDMDGARALAHRLLGDTAAQTLLARPAKPGLAVQLVNVLLLVVPCLFPLAAEGFRDHRQRLLFPEVDLGRVDTVFGGQFVNRFLLADRLKGHFSFKFRCMVLAYSKVLPIV